MQTTGDIKTMTRTTVMMVRLRGQLPDVRSWIAPPLRSKLQPGGHIKEACHQHLEQPRHLRHLNSPQSRNSHLVSSRE